MREKLAALGCDPVSELVSIAIDPKTEKALKVQILSGFVRFTQPVPKAVAFSEEEPEALDRTMTLEEVLTWSRYVIEHYSAHKEAIAPAENVDMQNDDSSPDENDARENE